MSVTTTRKSEPGPFWSPRSIRKARVHNMVFIHINSSFVVDIMHEGWVPWLSGSATICHVEDLSRRQCRKAFQGQ